MIQLSWIYWDPRPEIFTLPILDWPVLWYGALFALGFAIGFRIFMGVLTRFFNLQNEPESQKKALLIADKLTLYVVIGTVLGARLGHFLFYEKPSSYLKDPLEFFRVWEGGLASHGAAIGIILALLLFSYRIRPLADGLTWLRLLDFVAVPAAFCGACIRLGNFINQEVLGTPTDLPWAVLFAHPADHSLPVPRHPAQLYESFFYLAVFFLLWRLSHKASFLLRSGRLIGLFLTLVFGFRFFIEYLKVEQSRLLSVSSLTMGQYLSIPAVIAGLFLCFRRK
jgi:prolipoprotein diacylglyceryl transferase